MKKALWVKWSETWTAPLLRCALIEGLELDAAEKRIQEAEMARQLFLVEPMGHA